MGTVVQFPIQEWDRVANPSVRLQQVTVRLVDAARILGVSPSTVSKWVKRGLIPVKRVSRRCVLIRVRDLKDFVRPST